MAIKWLSLYPRTQFWCKNLCMELEKVIKQIWLKYVENLLRYWHFSPLPNLRLTRYKDRLYHKTAYLSKRNLSLCEGVFS